MVTIPWSKVKDDPYSWVERECVPVGFKWEDPSKMCIGEVHLLIGHWKERVKGGVKPLIWVSSCPLLEGAEQLPDRRRC